MLAVWCGARNGGRRTRPAAGQRARPPPSAPSWPRARRRRRGRRQQARQALRRASSCPSPAARRAGGGGRRPRRPRAPAGPRAGRARRPGRAAAARRSTARRVAAGHGATPVAAQATHQRGQVGAPVRTPPCATTAASAQLAAGTTGSCRRRARDHRRDAGHRPQRPVEAELAEEGRALDARGRQRPRSADQDADGDREVERRRRPCAGCDGARLTVMRCAGQASRSTATAARTRSRDSRQTSSGSPTIGKTGRPGGDVHLDRDGEPVDAEHAWRRERWRACAPPKTACQARRTTWEGTATAPRRCGAPYRQVRHGNVGRDDVRVPPGLRIAAPDCAACAPATPPRRARARGCARRRWERCRVRRCGRALGDGVLHRARPRAARPRGSDARPRPTSTRSSSATTVSPSSRRWRSRPTGTQLTDLDRHGSRRSSPTDPDVGAARRRHRVRARARRTAVEAGSARDAAG